MKTCIITAAKGYNVEQIAPWAESLRRSGYTGAAAVVLYEKNMEVVEYLGGLGIQVFIAEEQTLTHICAHRFQDYVKVLETKPFEEIQYVIHADIRDVIFQKDPEEWLLKNIGDSHLVATSEGVTFRHEDWNGEGVEFHCGTKAFNRLVDQEVLCAGIIAGCKEAVIHIFKTIFELCFYATDISGMVDQHFYNLAIRRSYDSITRVIPADQPWVANMATLVAIPLMQPEWSTGPKTQQHGYERQRTGDFVENMKVEMPQLIDGVVCTPDGEPYTIIHQYDRYKAWEEQILAKLQTT